MNTLKRGIALILSIVMILSLSMTAHADTVKHTEKAEALYELGLFKGTGTNADGTPIFSLQNKATRLQALIILIRLLGLEEEALATTEVNPFTDIPSGGVGEKYAAYAYSVGLTKGTSADKFGNGNVTPAQFATFVLRALGYSDIRVADAIAKGREIGLISDDLTMSGKTLLRDECVAINYNALKTKLKDTNTTLLEKLLKDGAVTEEAVAKSGIRNGTVNVPIVVTAGSHTKYSVNFRGADVLPIFPDAAYVAGGTMGGISTALFEKMDFSPLSVWLGSYPVRHMREGKANEMSPLTPNSQQGFNFNGGYNIATIAVLTKDLKLLAYCVIPPVSFTGEETELTFVTFDPFDGAKESTRIEKIIADVKHLNADGLYCEKVISKYADGTENSALYLRMDESKLPAELKGVQFYSLTSGANEDDLWRLYSSGRKDAEIKVLGKDTLPSNRFSGSEKDTPSKNGMQVYLYDSNKDIVACIALPYELPVVETVIQK